MATAAERTAGSTSRTPTYALVKIGGTASANMVMAAATKPPCCSRTIPGWMAMRVTRANEGMARAALAELSTRKLPLPVWPSRAPRPTPVMTAATTATAESSSWLSICDKKPSGPVQ